MKTYPQIGIIGFPQAYPYEKPDPNAKSSDCTTVAPYRDYDCIAGFIGYLEITIRLLSLKM